MTALDRIMLARAAEQVRDVPMGDARFIYEGTCKEPGCKTPVAYWNKMQMCQPHAAAERSRRRKFRVQTLQTRRRRSD